MSLASEGAQTSIRFTKYALNNWLRMMGPSFDASTALEMLGFMGPEVKEGLASHLDLFQVADIYTQNGASAISVLTDEKFFLGKLETLRDLRFTHHSSLVTHHTLTNYW